MGVSRAAYGSVDRDVELDIPDVIASIHQRAGRHRTAVEDYSWRLDRARDRRR
jgi:hypothetical protein